MFTTQSNMPVISNRHGHLKTTRDQLLSFEDIKAIHIIPAVGFRGARWTPPFALSMEKLRRVLLVRAWRYIHTNLRVAEPLDMAELDKRATLKALRGYHVGDHASRQQRGQVAVFTKAVQRAGSYMALESAIAFRAWRLGYNSVTIASELGMRPNCVRQHLCKLLVIARELGFDAGQNHPTRGRLNRASVENLKSFLNEREIDFDKQKLEALCKGM